MSLTRRVSAAQVYFHVECTCMYLMQGIIHVSFIPPSKPIILYKAISDDM